MKRSSGIILWALILIVLLTIGMAGLVYYLINEKAPQQDVVESKPFMVERGEKLDSIARRLEADGLLHHRFSLKLAAFFGGGSTQIKAGKHQIPTGLNALDVLKELKKSPPKEYFVLTIPEGWDSFEIGNLFEEKEICSAARFQSLVADTSAVQDLFSDATSLEGFLYPDTYHIPVDSSAKEIVDTMVRQFIEVYSREFAEQFASSNLSPYELIILASLVAKEAGNEEEMPLISSVFHNRLKVGMKLDCDPTFIYAGKMAGEWDKRIDGSDRNRQSPYNTYIYAGLPPGPIGNPGIAALRAAVAPQESQFIYFVAKSANQREGHYFSRTFSEHNQAVQKYREAKRKANQSS